CFARFVGRYIYTPPRSRSRRKKSIKSLGRCGNADDYRGRGKLAWRAENKFLNNALGLKLFIPSAAHATMSLIDHHVKAGLLPRNRVVYGLPNRELATVALLRQQPGDAQFL